MTDLLQIFGDWTWWILATVLLIAEILVPGAFILWFGLAALVVGLIHMIVPMGWHIEVLMFGALSVILLLIGRPLMRKKMNKESDQPNLNQRHMAFIGREFVLGEAIVDGSGRLNVDGTLWKINGADAAQGQWVKVVSVEGMDLMVEIIDK